MTGVHRYCVIETWTDGTMVVWGPFSNHRAEMCADALRDGDTCLESVRIMRMLSSSTFDREFPDWKRSVRV